MSRITAGLIPLIAARDIEANRSWEGISTPNDLLQYFIKHAAVDGSKIPTLNEFIYQGIEPAGSDRSKVWINTEGIISINIPVGGVYQKFYQYPPFVPLIWNRDNNLPLGFRALNEQELEGMSLDEPDNTKYYYVIFEPV